MSIANEITRISNAKAAIGTAIAAKGVTVPQGAKLDGMAALIAAISGAPEGLTEIAHGTFTLTSTQTQVTVAHGMSAAPTGFFIHYQDFSPNQSLVVAVYSYISSENKTKVIVAPGNAKPSSIMTTDFTISGTEISVHAPSGISFTSNQGYEWFAWR